MHCDKIYCLTTDNHLLFHILLCLVLYSFWSAELWQAALKQRQEADPEWCRHFYWDSRPNTTIFLKAFFMSLQQKGHRGKQFQETTWITSCCENTIEATKILVCFFVFPGWLYKTFWRWRRSGDVSSRVHFGHLCKQSGETVDNDKKTTNTARPAILFRWELLKHWSVHARPVVGGVNGISKRQNRTATDTAHLNTLPQSDE